MNSDLLDLAKIPKNKGCFSCGNYDSEASNNVEFVDDSYHDSGNNSEFKFDSQDYWVICKLEKEIETSIRIGCSKWGVNEN